jgi:hypothetical protein
MTDQPRPTRSPVTFFHGVLFVVGGGLALLWSWWGGLLVALAVLAAYSVARSMTSPGNAQDTRTRLERMQHDLLDLKSIAEHPTGSADEQARVQQILGEMHIRPPDEPTAP